MTYDLMALTSRLPKHLLKKGLVSSLLLGASLSACSVIPSPKGVANVYRLSVPTAIKTEAVRAAYVVNIEKPTASSVLSGTDITISPDGRKLTVAANAHWAEPIPEMLRHVLIDHLANLPRITGIIPKGNTRVPYRLNMDVRRFEAVFDGGKDQAPLAVVQLNFALTGSKNRALVGAHSVSHQVRASAASVSAIVEAQDRATKAAMLDISAWLETQLR